MGKGNVWSQENELRSYCSGPGGAERAWTKVSSEPGREAAVTIDRVGNYSGESWRIGLNSCIRRADLKVFESQAEELRLDTIGKNKTCPICGSPIVETWARVVGFITPKSAYNPVRRDFEFDRRVFYESEKIDEATSKIEKKEYANH